MLAAGRQSKSALILSLSLFVFVVVSILESASLHLSPALCCVTVKTATAFSHGVTFKTCRSVCVAHTLRLFLPHTHIHTHSLSFLCMWAKAQVRSELICMLEHSQRAKLCLCMGTTELGLWMLILYSQSPPNSLDYAWLTIEDCYLSCRHDTPADIIF